MSTSTLGAQKTAAELVSEIRADFEATGALGPARSQLLVAWARRIARKVVQNSETGLEDFAQDAVLAAFSGLGLVDWQRSDAEIARFLTLRMQGAVRDSLRKSDALGRDARRTQQRIESAVELRTSCGESLEIAEREVTAEVLKEVRSWTHRQRVLGLPVVDQSDIDHEAPETVVVAKTTTTYLTFALMDLFADPACRQLGEHVVAVLLGEETTLDETTRRALMERFGESEAVL
jgi:hypothetical protein